MTKSELTIGTRVQGKYRKEKIGTIEEIQSVFTGSHPGFVFEDNFTIRFNGEQFTSCMTFSFIKCNFRLVKGN